MFLQSAFLLGLAGSLHCAAMCGPLVLALPLDARTRWRLVGQSLTYHAGRVLMYAILGYVFGWLGYGLQLAGLQKVVAILSGLVMLLAAWLIWRGQRHWLDLATKGKWLRRPMQWLLHQLNTQSGRVQWPWFSLGLLNGLLPCGMVYLALAGAVASGTSGWEGAAYLALFGLGTTPLLLILMATGQRLQQHWRTGLRYVQTVFLVSAALVLLYRGVYLEWGAVSAGGEVFGCH